MQFYKFEGIIQNENWAQENNDRRILREKTRRIYLKSLSFNRKLAKKAFVFTVDAENDTMTGGVISPGNEKPAKLVGGY